MRDALDRLRGGGGGGGGRGGASGRFRGRPGGAFRGAGALAGEDFLERFHTLFPNPAALVLELRDSLGLTDEQAEAIAAVRDSLKAGTDSLAAELRSEIEQLGTNRDPRAFVALIRPTTQIARANVVRSVSALRRILTAEQWALLPVGLRNAGGQRRPPRRRGGERP